MPSDMNTFSFKKIKIPSFYRHVFSWTLYTIYLYGINVITNPRINPLSIVIFELPFILVFYTSLFVLRLFKKKQILLALILFVSFFLSLSLMGYGYIYVLLPLLKVKLYSGAFEVSSFIQSAISGYIKFFIYALLFFFIDNSFNNERKLRELQEQKFLLEKQKKQKELENILLKQQELQGQQEKLQYEYAFLRAQVNPHFLYNTLNVLFSQALPYSQNLADNILKLSNVMRYSLESLEYESGKVSIQKEIEHMQTLIDIHNIRFSDSSVIKYNVSGNVEGQMLPPLSIITILENALKYGDLKDPKNPLLINLTLKPKQIHFYCRNKKRKNTIEIPSNNIGITNLGKRLDDVFKNKYEMKVTDEDEFYTFELIINN